MIETISLFPGITLRCCRDSRFKQGCLTVQLVRRTDARETAMNALLGAVLLRGTERCPDMRSITRQHGNTLVMVTHDPTVAAHADRVITILDGVIIDITDNSAAHPTDTHPLNEEEPA